MRLVFRVDASQDIGAGHVMRCSAIIEEAISRNINSRADALKALKANGISENEARQMARQQGLDYDSFLNSYFPNQTNTPTGTGSITGTNARFVDGRIVGGL